MPRYGKTARSVRQMFLFQTAELFLSEIVFPALRILFVLKFITQLFFPVSLMCMSIFVSRDFLIRRRSAPEHSQRRTAVLPRGGDAEPEPGAGLQGVTGRGAAPYPGKRLRACAPLRRNFRRAKGRAAGRSGRDGPGGNCIFRRWKGRTVGEPDARGDGAVQKAWENSGRAL